jgi:hypothetical protein
VRRDSAEASDTGEPCNNARTMSIDGSKQINDSDGKWEQVYFGNMIDPEPRSIPDTSFVVSYRHLSASLDKGYASFDKCQAMRALKLTAYMIR